MEASDFTGHISRRFNKDIEDLRSKVLAMGGLVESQLSQAIAAIVSGDSELGLKVAHDDYKVNNLEVEIDEQCGRILATRAPAAGDLRLIVAIIKTITDLDPDLWLAIEESVHRLADDQQEAVDLDAYAEGFSEGVAAVWEKIRDDVL